jgi:copper chaperone NosL
MTLTDLRLGGEAVTRSGKTYPFDDVLCLALFVRDTVVPPTRLHSLWVTDYLRPGRLLEATGAHYLRLTGLHTPMASGLAAFATAEEADSVRRADPSGGEALTWAQVLAGATAHPPGAVPPPDAS